MEEKLFLPTDALTSTAVAARAFRILRGHFFPYLSLVFSAAVGSLIMMNALTNRQMLLFAVRHT